MKLPKALNEATAGAALKYHIKRALERSHSISDFSKNLELSAKNAKFSNNTLKIIEELTNGVKQASEELNKKASDLQHATTPLKEFGRNYPEFALKPKEALEKLLQEKNGQVAGAAFREDLGGIDFVWGTPKTKDSVGYGLAHIIESRENQYKKLGLTPEQAKERTNELIKEIPNIIQKGLKEEDRPGYVAIILNNSKVILSKFKGDKELKNHYMITSFEVDEKVLRELETIAPLPNDYRDGGSISNLNRDNPTQKPLTDQEDLLKNTELDNESTPKPTNLSPLEQAEAKKLAKLQHAITPLKEFGKNYPEFALKPKEALKKLLQEKNGQVAGAAYREDLGGIDFVWGTPKTKDSVGYGLAHIIERREQQAFSDGLSEAEAKEYALNIVKSIPEVLEKGSKGTDHLGRVFVDYRNIRVGLNNTWNNKDLENHWVISSYELRDTTEKPTHFPTSQAITKEKDIHSLNSVEPNLTTNALKSQTPLSEQANAKKLAKLQHAITPLKEFGKNYPEFALKPKEALKKLLQEKNGQVAGAAYREDLGGIDFVWGNKDYGLEHILEKRKKQYKRLGLTNEQAKERTNELIKEIPNIIQKGLKEEDKPGYAVIILNNSKVVLSKFKGDNELKNHYMITSFEADDKVLRELETIATLSNDYRDGINYSTSNLNEPNSTTNALTDQEDLLNTSENLNETTPKPTNLSPLEQANAEKLAKLESEKLESEKEFTRLKEQEVKRKEALKKKLEHERGNAGNIESQTKIEVGDDIPTHTQAQIPKSRVRLNEREIYDLDYAIVKAKDLKPSFSTGGTQKRTDMNEEQIKSIAENFDPKKIFGSGGFEDLPIILHDGQVIAGNHRIQGMLNFTPKSRYSYEKAIKEYYNIDLKPDELLVRVPHKRLNNTEINNLAASSNQGRFNSESDHAIAVLSHYEAKLKELDQKLDADSIYSLKNIVAKNLNFDKATHPNVGDSNLALLMFNMPRTKTQGIELLNRWQKEFSNDIKSYEKVKKMFVDNAGSFHNLIHDLNFPNVSLNAYLSDIMDRSFANLKNYQTTSESLKDLSEKFYKTSSLDMFEKSDQSTSDISEILGGAIARFARFDDPSKALFEALKSDNIKKGLKEFKIADVAKDMFNPKSKEFKDIDIYDFAHYLLMVNREPNENNPVLKRLIEAVKDMQKESEKGIKEASKKSSQETEKEVKERAFKVIEDKEAFLKDLNAIKPMQLPKEIDTDSFLNAFNGVENKENFIKHLKSKPDSKHRLAYLNLVEPTLKEPDITLIFKDKGKEVKKEHIKAFKGDPKTIYYFLVTQDNDNKLITGLRTSENYLKAEIDKADIIHSFIPQDS